MNNKIDIAKNIIDLYYARKNDATLNTAWEKDIAYIEKHARDGTVIIIGIGANDIMPSHIDLVRTPGGASNNRVYYETNGDSFGLCVYQSTIEDFSIFITIY